MKFTTRKYDGDDQYSWAVFRKNDLPKGHRGIVFYGEARPVVCGLSRHMATYHRKNLETKDFKSRAR